MTGLGWLVLILAAAALSPLVVEILSRWIPVSPVVVEIGLGIVIGPAALGWAHDGGLVTFVADAGLATLMFLAGYEIDLSRIWGSPLWRGLLSWGGSLAIGLVVAFGLSSIWALPPIIVALASTTSAVGTILPILRDRHDSRTHFGTLVLTAGMTGEIGPVIATTLALTTDRPARTAGILLVFVAIAAAALVLAARPLPPLVTRVVGTTLHTSGQFVVRLAVLLLITLVWAASRAHLDILLGAFAGGLIFRQLLRTQPRALLEVVGIKLDGIGFGFLIPVFFVVSGIRFDVSALTSQLHNLLLLPLFGAVFLATRAVPVQLVYRPVLDGRDRAAAGLYLSAQLPIVVVITSIGVQTGRMSAAVAAAMVGAGMLSVLVFPLAAAALRPAAPVAAPTPSRLSPQVTAQSVVAEWTEGP